MKRFSIKYSITRNDILSIYVYKERIKPEWIIQLKILVSQFAAITKPKSSNCDVN